MNQELLCRLRYKNTDYFTKGWALKVTWRIHTQKGTLAEFFPQYYNYFGAEIYNDLLKFESDELSELT